MKKNISRTEEVKGITRETKITANKAVELIGPLRDWTWGTPRKSDPYSRYLAGVSRLGNHTNRSRRDDTPPAASAIVV